ncbi:MAG: RING finger protein [Pirellulaceae bacterium]|nr:RING finger protein [Pirellulaceae bacterium]
MTSCIAVTVIAFVAATRARRRNLFDALETLGDRRGASPLRARLEGERISFVAGAVKVQVSIEVRRRKRWLAIHFAESFPVDFSMEIGSRSLWRRGPRVGERRFRRDYFVKGEPSSQVRDAITPGVQARIAVFRTETERNRLRVLISGGNMTVLTRHTPVNAAVLGKIIDTAIPVFEELAGVLAVGIDLADSIVSSDPGHCRICGETLNDNIVYCRRCRTPHHKDCWKFNGSCSMFACGERRFQKRPPQETSTRSS